MFTTDGETRHERFERHARTLFESMAEGLVICEAIRDDTGRLVDYWIRDANPIFLERAPEGEDAIGRTLLSMRPGTSPWWFERCEAALHGEDVRFEFEDPQSGRWYDAHMTGLSADEFSQFFMDISHRKAAEARQRELFDELNHRVKNNLAIVSSILELQARGASADVRAHLAQAAGRVRTIAELHNVLYQRNSTDHVNLCDYLNDLCALLRSAFLQTSGIRLDIVCAPISIAVKEAVSLGLIVNELVTNSAKHGFVGKSPGRVEVAVTEDGDDLRLRVSDDGVGLTQQQVKADGLGLRMVRALADGLPAEVQVLDGLGAAVEIVLRRATVSR